MNVKAAKIASLVMLTVSLLITLFLLGCAISGIFIIQAVPPVVVMFLFTAYWVWIDTVYLRCYQCLRNAQRQIPDNLNVQGIVLTALMGSTALSMWVVFFGSILVLGGFAPVMLNFLGIAVVFTVYTVMTLLILFALHKRNEKAELK